MSLAKYGLDNCIPECIVCFNALEKDISCLPCGHIFHSECLRTVIQHQSRCPMCRKSTTSTSIIKLVFDNSTVSSSTSKIELDSKLMEVNELLRNKLDENEESLNTTNHQLNNTLLSLKYSNSAVTNILNQNFQDSLKRHEEKRDLKLLLSTILTLEKKLKMSFEEKQILNLKVKKSEYELEQNRSIIKNLLSQKKKAAKASASKSRTSSNSKAKKQEAFSSSIKRSRKKNISNQKTSSSKKSKTSASMSSTKKSMNKTFLKISVVKPRVNLIKNPKKYRSFM